MYKLTILSCLAALLFIGFNLPSAPNAHPLNVAADREQYYRYQLVGLTVTLDTSVKFTRGAARAAAWFHHGDSLIEGVGQMREAALSYDSAAAMWRGTWAMPWNPPLGRYIAVVRLIAGRDTLTDSTFLYVRARQPRSIPEGFCVMTIESEGNLLNNKTPSPFNDQKTWKNFKDYAQYLGADAVWYSVGWTNEVSPGITDKNPWVRANLRVFPELAAECHRNGLQFGGYVGSYLLWPPNLTHRLKYGYSLDVKGGIFRNAHVDLDDAKRRQDIVYVLRLLQADSNVDFIGLDYIRPGAGGYETVDAFVRLMNIATPRDWERWPQAAKIVWVAKQVKPVSEQPVRVRWHWWQAHRAALAVERLLRNAEITKPVWGFTLGWEKGHQHGQDPCMMNDAGLDLDAVMLYESNALQCREMTGQWSKYLQDDEAQLLPGEQIDWELLQRSVVPPAPEELYWRLTDAIKGTSNGGRVKGLFCHDMFRSFKGRRGPHGAREWLTAAAAAFTKVRQELKVFPVSARLFTRNGSLLLYLRNHGATAPLPLKIEALSPQSPLKVKEIALQPGTLDTTVTLGARPQYGLASYRITWGSAAARDRIVLFKYFPEAYAEQPFRSVQSFRAGGDVLIALNGDQTAQGQALEIGRAVRGLGLVPNTVQKDSLTPDLRYKYPVLVIISSDTLITPCLAAANGWSTRPLVISGARNTGKADCDYIDRFEIAAVTEAILARLSVAPRRPKIGESGPASTSR